MGTHTEGENNDKGQGKQDISLPDNNENIEPKNQLIVYLTNGLSHQSITASNVIAKQYVDQRNDGRGTPLEQFHPIEFRNRVIYFLLASTFILSIFNVVLISFVIKSTKLSREGLAGGRITVTDNGILIDVLTKLNNLLMFDSIQSGNGQNLQLNSNETGFDIINSHGTRLLLDKRVEIQTKRFEYIDTNTRSKHGQVLIATDGPDNSVSLAATRLDPNTRSGYNLQGHLQASEITGMMNHDLEIQSRTGSIHIKSEANQKIQSKASSVDLLSHNSFTLSASKINFGSGKVRVEKGLIFFDELVAENGMGSEHRNIIADNTNQQPKFNTNGYQEALEAAELLSYDGWLCHA